MGEGEVGEVHIGLSTSNTGVQTTTQRRDEITMGNQRTFTRTGRSTRVADGTDVVAVRGSGRDMVALSSLHEFGGGDNTNVLSIKTDM